MLGCEPRLAGFVLVSCLSTGVLASLCRPYRMRTERLAVGVMVPSVEFCLAMFGFWLLTGLLFLFVFCSMSCGKTLRSSYWQLLASFRQYSAGSGMVALERAMSIIKHSILGIPMASADLKRPQFSQMPT